MKKGWQIRKIVERAWDYKFTRWYIIAPSGNKYFMYRSFAFDTIYIPTDYYYDHEFEEYYPITSHLIRINKSNIFERCDNYHKALKYIYAIEQHKSGFKNQAKNNICLGRNKEMIRLFSRLKHTVTYDSMPC